MQDESPRICACGAPTRQVRKRDTLYWRSKCATCEKGRSRQHIRMTVRSVSLTRAKRLDKIRHLESWLTDHDTGTPEQWAIAWETVTEVAHARGYNLETSQWGT